MQKLTKERIETFIKTISNLKKDVAILSGIADPDSLASAQLIANILIAFDKNPNIFFQNDKDDPSIAIWENSFELVGTLGVTSTFLENPEKYSVILLDFNDLKILNIDPEKIKIDIVIDHHERVIDEENVGWSWIDKCGACASMILYIYSQIKDVTPIIENENLSTQITTAITTDLGNNFLTPEATIFDMQMFTIARTVANMEKVNDLSHSYYNKKLFNLIGEAWNNHSEKSNVIVTHVNLGSIKESDHVFLAVIADLLYKFTCFDIVIVWAKTEDTKRLLYKARSSRKEVSLDHVIKTQFGEAGGARAGKGAGSLPPLPKVFDPLNEDAEKAFITYMQLQMFALASQYASE